MSKRRAAGKAVTKNPKAEGRSPAKRRVLKTLKWLLIVGVVFAVIGVVGFVYLYQTTDIPDVNEDFTTETTKVYYDGGKQELGSFAVQDRNSISLGEMPKSIKDAVVSAEDQSFWTNKGIDPKGIVRAAFNNASGNSTQGASTITQQYVKILYLNQERTLKRKVQEAFLSLKVQRTQSKEEILEGYLNTIYFGRGAYGVDAASTAYFRKPASELNLSQSAVLASILNNPNSLDPRNGKDAKAELLERYQYVLNRMVEDGYITATEHDQVYDDLPKVRKPSVENQYGEQRGHALALVKQELLSLEDANGDQLLTEQQIDGGGLRVTTTLTPEAMAAAAEGQAAVRPSGFPGQKELHVAVASVEPGTGRLLGFYGGQDYLKSQINWAEAGGMAGSTFKAFANVAGIRAGFSLKDTFEGNSPIVLDDGLEVENQGNESYGSSVSMLQATEDSINTAYIDMTDSMPDGPKRVVQAAEDMGIPGNEPAGFGIPDHSVDVQDNLGVALGTAQVSPINMANAYATLAAGGVRSDVHVIDRVVAKDGRELYRYKNTGEQAVDPDIAADVSYSLQQVVSSGSGTEALNLGRPAAGKTGTATNGAGEVSSSWFVGYTPQVSTAVMYVRGEGRGKLDDWLPASSDGRAGYFGGNYPAKTWTAVMQPIMEGLPVEEFPEPVYVDGEAPTDGHEPTPTYVPPTTQPTQPTKPTKPTETEEPTEPSEPTEPTEPTGPTGPTSPTGPTTPTEPSNPGNPDGPNGPDGPGGDGGRTGVLADRRLWSPSR